MRELNNHINAGLVSRVSWKRIATVHLTQREPMIPVQRIETSALLGEASDPIDDLGQSVLDRWNKSPFDYWRND